MLWYEAPELGALGWARVTSVSPCPPIEPGRGNVVLGTYRHVSADVRWLTTTDLEAPLGITGTHPVWSEDRQAFVPAAQLQSGEQLRGMGERVELLKSRRDGAHYRVFNLEVAGEHAYLVSRSAILVHNYSQHYSHSPDGVRLHNEAQQYRASHPDGANQHRNFATADVNVNGNDRVVRFKNDPDGMHSEQRLVAWEDAMRRRGNNVRVNRVYSERPPCGAHSANCRETLEHRYGSDLEIYHGNR